MVEKDQMLNKEEIHQVWAPPQARWSRWVKPVLFAFTNAALNDEPRSRVSLKLDWLPAPGPVALVVDLPRDQGIIWGMELAKSGYRPIPLYNALPFPPQEMMTEPGSRIESTVDVVPILAAICRSTPVLKEIQLSPEAPPAFLLDADRRVARLASAPGRFDNRSVCFPTDFPSAEFLSVHGIHQAIIVQRSNTVAADLVQALIMWQKSGIQLFRVSNSTAAVPSLVVLVQPSWLRRLWNRISIALGLPRGELGFGGIIPTGSG
jgi:hypothetical protein